MTSYLELPLLGGMLPLLLGKDGYMRTSILDLTGGFDRIWFPLLPIWSVIPNRPRVALAFSFSLL